MVSLYTDIDNVVLPPYPKTGIIAVITRQGGTISGSLHEWRVEQHMWLIIIGVILEGFDYNIVINNTHRFDILPDFLGFFLVFLGMRRLVKREMRMYEELRQGKIVAVILILMSVLDMLMAFTGSSYGGQEITMLKEMIELVLVYFCYKKIVDGFVRVEKQEEWDLNTDRLFRTLTFMLVARVLCFVVAMQGTILLIPAVLFSMVMCVMFARNLYVTEKRYVQEIAENK